MWLPQAFYMIRFHSFYPWHTGGDYRQLCTQQDLDMLPWVQEFKCVVPQGGAGSEGDSGLKEFSDWCPLSLPLSAASLTSTPSALTYRK